MDNNELNEKQREAVTFGEGPLLIIAGAGTGKTRVITERIAWLIMEKKIPTESILALTFTEKAAEEMEERVDKLLPYGYVDLWISTFHAFCDKILKRHALEIGLPNNYKLLDETESWLLIRKNLQKFNLDHYRPLGNPTKFIHALIKHFSRCKDEGIQPEDYLRYAEEIRLNADNADFVKELESDDISGQEDEALRKSEILRIAEIANSYHIYQQILLDNDALDFGDLINNTLTLFKKRPMILEKYRRQFQYILVDEFQDTNLVQYELVKLLAEPKNNIGVVGDDDQAIYKFRGASISNIMQFKEDFPASKEVVLAENYRSRQEILDLAHKFIVQNNPYRLEEKLGICKKLKAGAGAGAEVGQLRFVSADEEVRAVADKIIEMRNGRGADWSDFAILVRANDSAAGFIAEFESRGIPYQFVALRGLYNKPSVVDVINYLRLLDNYHESAALFRVLNLSCFNIPAEQIVLVSHYAKKNAMSLFEALRRGALISGARPEAVAEFQRVLSLIEKGTESAKRKKPTEIILEFLENSGYLNAVQKLNEGKSKEIFSHLQQFLKRAKGFEQSSANSSVKEFLGILEMEAEAGESGKLSFDLDVGPDMVKIMTVHSAKGLEFKYVFIVNLAERKFPTDERGETIEIPAALIKEKLPEGDYHLSEERRLFYVAMTRAKEGLFFTSAEDYGGIRKRKPSRFLQELGLTEIKQNISGWKAAGINNPAKINKQDSSDGLLKQFLPKYFSYSQMQTYETCPLKYKFSNVLNIPIFGNHYFTFGTTIHTTLCRFFEESARLSAVSQQTLFGAPAAGAEKRFLTLEQLNELYDKCWSDEWFLDEWQKNQYYNKGKDIIKKFHSRVLAENPNVIHLEKIFSVKIGNYNFGGRIDRIDDLGDGCVEIIDYKTGEGKGGGLDADDKRQLLLYQIAAQELFKLKLSKLTYYYLEPDKKVSFVGEPDEMAELKERFLRIISLIEAQDFTPKPNPHICGRCEYRHVCEYKKI